MFYTMANKRQRRQAKKVRRRERPVDASAVHVYARPADRVERLTYTRRQAAEALGVSLSTIDRRVVPVLSTFFNDWGMRLIPVDELKRYVAENTRAARREVSTRRPPGRRPNLAPEVIARIYEQAGRGKSLGAIARGLNVDGICTAQGGRQWWPSTVRAVLARTARVR